MESSLIKLKQYEKELLAIEAELKLLPLGRLLKRGNFFYQVINQKEIGITKNPELINEYHRKKYLLTRQRQLKHNMPNVSSFINQHKTILPIDTIRTFTSTYQQLPLSVFYHPSVKKWMDEPVIENQFYAENRRFPTNNKIKVRSKSEQTIANLLEEYGLLYRYDAEFKLGNQRKFPDFVIINPFNGKEFIWEHFGLLNNPVYIDQMNDKMKLYSAHNYFPFENIIYTFEFDIEHPQRLRDIIENIILGI